MTSGGRTVCPNQDEIAVEVLDGEAVLINLATGHYYTMEKVGAAIWEMIEKRRSTQDIITGLVATYDVDPDRAGADLDVLLDALLEERLVKALISDVPLPDGSSVAAGARLPYETPRLTKYSDMADLLALDPPLPGLRDLPWKEPGRK